MTTPIHRMLVNLASGEQQSVELSPEEVASHQATDQKDLPELSFAQMVSGLVYLGWITEAEGLAWIDGILPGDVEALIATLPVPVRFAWRARAARPTSILRQNPIVNALAAHKDKTPAQVDQFFIYASTL